jgi:hypothetical protein
MPRELVISSARSLDVGDCLVAMASVDPDLGLRQLHDGVAVQICRTDGSAALTLARTLRMDVVDDAGRMVGAPLDVSHTFWTELYLPLASGDDLEDRLALALAEASGGTLHSRSLDPHTQPAGSTS